MTEQTAPEPAEDRSRLRLGRVIEQRKKSEGGYAALARAISESVRGRAPARKSGSKKPKDEVDRRKLQALANGDREVVLSLRELRALDGYLEPFGEGLAYRPLFEKPDLIQTLADSRGPITFLLGSKKALAGGRFPHWDVLAMADIQRSLSSSEVSVQVDIQDVTMYPEFKLAEFPGGEPWPKLFDERGPSLVVLASNRIMPAAEVMLCKMFGGEPFRNQLLEQKRDQRRRTV